MICAVGGTVGGTKTVAVKSDDRPRCPDMFEIR